MTSPRKTCSKFAVVEKFPIRLRACNLNQICHNICLNGTSPTGARPAEEWKEFSGVNIALFLRGCSAPSTTGWFPQPHTLRASVYVVLRLVYDSCQINQFNNGKMWICIDSITMNRYYLNIPTNSIMLLSTYELTQSIQKNDSNALIKSNNQLNIYLLTFLESLPFRWPFLENVRFRWPFWDILNQLNRFNRTSPSKSIGSVTYLTKTNWLSHQSLTWKRNWIKLINFAEKMNRFKSINSVELIRIQV